MEKIKLVVMGAGMIGREHCELITGHAGTELVGLADISNTGYQYAAGLKIPYFEDYTQMLDEAEPSGAIVALPNTLHLPAALACIKRGIPSMIEKPVAESIPVALKLTEASDSTGVPVLVGHHRRHSPDIYEARRVVKDGLLGDVVAASGLWFADKPDDYFDAEWRRNPGGGPLLINLIHDIDCLRFIVGEIESVSAFTSNARRGFEVEDTASIAIRFENGALGSFLISDSVASPYTWEMTSGQALYFPSQPGDCFHFGGTKATLAVPSMTLWRHEDETKHWQDPIFPSTLPLDGSETYPNQLQHFLEVIAGNAEPIITARDATMTLAATLAVDRAAREERTVRVAEMLG